LEKHKRLEEAIEQYRQALQVDPRFVDAHIDLASALFAKGELPEAKAHFLEATRLDPKLAQPHNYLGEIFMREGDTSQAIAQFEQALRLHPDFPEAEENLRLAKASDPQFPAQSPQ
jgi:superkiller protein 3